MKNFLGLLKSGLLYLQGFQSKEHSIEELEGYKPETNQEKNKGHDSDSISDSCPGSCLIFASNFLGSDQVQPSFIVLTYSCFYFATL